MASRRNHENPNPDTTNEVRPDDGPIRRHRPEEPTEVEAFLGRNWSTMNQKARSLTSNVHDANDLVQQCALNVIRSLGTFRGGSEGAWVRSILTNQNYSNHRGRRSTEVSLDALTESASERGAKGADGPVDPLSDTADSVIEHLECEALSPILAKAVSALSDRQRKSFHLRVVKEYSWSEVAKEMECDEHKARSYHFNACANLRKKLAAMGVTENYGGEGE
jgi:RNA polymerase sigma factor (sigma-70 family)